MPRKTTQSPKRDRQLRNLTKKRDNLLAERSQCKKLRNQALWLIAIATITLIIIVVCGILANSTQKLWLTPVILWVPACLAAAYYAIRFNQKISAFNKEITEVNEAIHTRETQLHQQLEKTSD